MNIPSLCNKSSPLSFWLLSCSWEELLGGTFPLLPLRFCCCSWRACKFDALPLGLSVFSATLDTSGSSMYPGGSGFFLFVIFYIFFLVLELWTSFLRPMRSWCASSTLSILLTNLATERDWCVRIFRLYFFRSRINYRLPPLSLASVLRSDSWGVSAYVARASTAFRGGKLTASDEFLPCLLLRVESSSIVFDMGLLKLVSI